MQTRRATSLPKVYNGALRLSQVKAQAEYSINNTRSKSSLQNAELQAASYKQHILQSVKLSPAQCQKQCKPRSIPWNYNPQHSILQNFNSQSSVSQQSPFQHREKQVLRRKCFNSEAELKKMEQEVQVQWANELRQFKKDELQEYQHKQMQHTVQKTLTHRLFRAPLKATAKHHSSLTMTPSQMKDIGRDSMMNKLGKLNRLDDDELRDLDDLIQSVKTPHGHQLLQFSPELLQGKHASSASGSEDH